MLAPFKIRVEDPYKSLALCMSSLIPTRATGIRLVLSQLAKLAPTSLLEVSPASTPSGASAPVPWSIRWCLLAGSFCDVLIDHDIASSVFWPALLEALSSEECVDHLDIWGADRKLDARTLQALQHDPCGVLWGQWLSCAMLSGMLPVELSQCPALAVEVLLRRWGVVEPKVDGFFNLAAASALVDNQAACTLQSSARVAVASVVALTAATKADTMVRLACGASNVLKEGF